MVSDVTLMVRNAELFWGPESEYAKLGRKMLDKLMLSLNHERITLGVDFDAIRVMEDCIKKLVSSHIICYKLF